MKRIIVINQKVESCCDRNNNCHYFESYYGGYRCNKTGKSCGDFNYIENRLWNNCPFKNKTTAMLPRCAGKIEFIYTEEREKEVKEMMKKLKKVS